MAGITAPFVQTTSEVPQIFSSGRSTQRLLSSQDLQPQVLEPTATASSLYTTREVSQLPPSSTILEPTVYPASYSSLPPTREQVYSGSPPASAVFSLPPSAHRLEPSRSYVGEAAPSRIACSGGSTSTLPPSGAVLLGPAPATQRPALVRKEELLQPKEGARPAEEDEADDLTAWDAFLGEEEEDDPLPVPSDSNLEVFSEEELQSILEEREQAIASLQEEIAYMQRTPGHFEARLVRLEEIFGRVTPGDIIQVEAPALASIHAALERDHLLDHDEAVERKDPHLSQVGLHRDGSRFPLGRGYLPIDQYELARERAAEELKVNHHPTMKRTHYAGHMASEGHVTDAVFVCAGGVEERRTLYPGGYGYWLHNLTVSGEKVDPVSESGEADGFTAEDFVEPGVPPDNAAIDWLGQMKRGLPVENPHPKDPWQPPSWMY